MLSLKTFIKAVRKSKTIADERAVISKESASIRTAFRNKSLDQNQRRVNIYKLIYLYILGEKTHFGQVECLKLLASLRFADKRLGYLATMLFLDENQEVLTLLTNSLDNDLQHSNSFIVGLALCCLGNVASPELARDLYTNVERILSSNSVYLKKKACLVAAKLVDKEPDLAEFFLPHVSALVAEKQPAILLGVTRLVSALYKSDNTHHADLMEHIPSLLSHLQRVATQGYMPDYDVSGTADPFLKVALLGCVRVLALSPQCPPKYMELINDILAQVASTAESGKNAAHAVLYECIKTIFAIPTDQSLKILGINLLGKFLATKDNNTSYVALDTLLQVVESEPIAVQRHRATIIACLNDGDVSIRRRAIELSFAILNEQNIRVLTREILPFLETSSDSDLKPYVTSQIAIAANKFAPNEKWRFLSLSKMLKVAGNYVTPDIISNILALLLQCSDSELKSHVVLNLYSMCCEDVTQYGLSLITVWAVGEYADLILNQSTEAKDGAPSQVVTERLIISLLKEIAENSTFLEAEAAQIATYTMTAIIKLSTRFSNPQNIETLRLMLSEKTCDNNLEIQVRAVEYQQIFIQDLKLRKGLLAKMPPPPHKMRASLSLNKQTENPRTGKNSENPPQQADLLLDLMDGDVGNSSSGGLSAMLAATNTDLLSDIFGNKPASAHADLAVSAASGRPAQINLGVEVSPDAIVAFSDAKIKVSFAPIAQHEPGHVTTDAFIESNTPSNVIENIQLMIAVPKSQKLTISTFAGGDTLAPDSPLIRQALTIVGKAGGKIKLRVKVRYVISNNATEEQFDFAGFNGVL